MSIRSIETPEPWAQGPTPGITSEEYKTDALGNRPWVQDPEVVDQVDRTRYQSYTAEAGQLTSMALGTAGCGLPPNNFSCHPAWYKYEYNQRHDANGNVNATLGKVCKYTQVPAPDKQAKSRTYRGSFGRPFWRPAPTGRG